MRRALSCRLSATAMAVFAGYTCPFSLSHDAPLLASAQAPTFLTATPLCRFDIRKHEMEKRRLRELEKAGIDPERDGDEPWIAPEERQRLDEEEEARRAEEEERRQEFLARRAEEDEAKRQRFREFRAKQIAMSRKRKEAVAGQKAAAREERENARVVYESKGEGSDSGNNDAAAAVEGEDDTKAGAGASGSGAAPK